jgi:transposase
LVPSDLGPEALDAEAICEAVARPNMRFVRVKSPKQQSARRAKEFVHARSAQASQIRGLLLEAAIAIRPGMRPLYDRVADLIEDAKM